MANLKQNQHTDRQVLEAVKAIKTAILQGQYEAAKDVNRVQLALYFAVGRFLSKNTRQGVWGLGAIDAISQQLRKELPGLRGFSASNLKNMRLFYEEWMNLNAHAITRNINSPIVIGELQNDNNQLITESPIATDENTTSADDNVIDLNNSLQIPLTADFPIEDFFKVPFTHHIRILEREKEREARYYYIHRTAEEHLSANELIRLIQEDSFHHQALIPNNFSHTIPNAASARKAVMMFKDNYLLNFINVEEIGERESIDVDERVVEQQIIENIKKFIMTFGNDFAFIGSQYHLEVYGVEQFPDLLFFNRELNALVVIELKTGAFKTSYLGQLMRYLSILDAKVKKPHENPSIGIVLCKDADKDFVEFVIRDYSKPMGVATYTTTKDMPDQYRNALPDIDELKQLL